MTQTLSHTRVSGANCAVCKRPDRLQHKRNKRERQACLDGGQPLLRLVRGGAEDRVRQMQVPNRALGRRRPRRIQRHECVRRMCREPLQIVEPVGHADGCCVGCRVSRVGRGAEEVPGRPGRVRTGHQVDVGVQVDVIGAVGDRFQQRPHTLRRCSHASEYELQSGPAIFTSKSKPDQEMILPCKTSQSAQLLCLKTYQNI